MLRYEGFEKLSVEFTRVLTVFYSVSTNEINSSFLKVM